MLELMAHGPVEVGISVYSDFPHYQSGVYEEPSCTNKTDHCISIWGWGTSDQGVDYWIIKNSWGTSWGMDGLLPATRADTAHSVGD